jgi:(1->4)-alpha-D-glucan 1-alpha-D-glucosylmutase
LPPFADIVYEKKKLVIDALFAGELRSLAHAFEGLAALCGVPIAPDSIADCITEVSACLPVYRTYITAEIGSSDRCVIKSAITAARHRAPAVPDASYSFLRSALFGEDLPAGCEARRAEFIASWQQFTGPVMAKGLEDTAFYTYNRLIALSEVGAHPDAVVASAREFHEIMSGRAHTWPHTMNASSTHDTKRSEDVRARILVLSEMPEVWERAVDAWSRIGERYVTTWGDKAQPELNEQLMIFQTLLGVWPLHDSERASLAGRLHGFLEKAAREAKQHSSWLEPDESYEQALYEFTDRLIADPEFIAGFMPLQQDVAWYGALNSLSQLVVKLGAPGVPDIYQGNESWSYSLVDPDNRRPVDFEALSALLDELPTDINRAAAAEMLRSWRDGRIKMHVTHTGLKLRRALRETFTNGEYIGLPKRGRFARNVIPFARRLNDDWVVIAAGRFFSKLGPRPLGAAWGDTLLDLPADAPRAWRNLLTGEVTDGRSLEAVFATLPFAMLVPA